VNNTFDVIIIGAGASGLSAAIEAATSGARTLVLEKNAIPGGSSRLSVGSINAAGTSLQRRAGIVDTPDEHFEDMDYFMGSFALKENRAFRRILVDNAAETVEWMISLGMTFYGPTGDPPHRHPRMHNILPNSRAYPYFLGRQARRLGAEIRVNTSVRHLLRGSDGGVRGVCALVDGVEVEIEARLGVIITAGDYSNSADLKKTFRPELASIPAVNPTATGDGHRMGEAFGARILNGDVIYGPGLRFCEPPTISMVRRLPPSRVLGSLMEWAMRNVPVALFRPFVLSFMTASLGPELSILRAGAILINSAGERFTDELQPAGLAIAGQEGGLAWMVFDQRVAELFSKQPHYVSTAPGVAFAYLPDYKRHRKDLYHCETGVVALARSIGLPEKALVASIEAHNVKLFSPGGVAGHQIRSQEKLYALGPLQSKIVITDGGLAVNTSHQVLREDNSVIPRLYAAGAAGQGGVLLAGNGHHICWAAISGRRAGRHVVGVAEGVKMNIGRDQVLV
jgi:hypothetical protein